MAGGTAGGGGFGRALDRLDETIFAHGSFVTDRQSRAKRNTAVAGAQAIA